MRRFLILSFLLFSSLQAIEWSELPKFTKNGIEGAFIGTDGNYLFIAGGETSKGFSKTIHVFRKTKRGKIRYLKDKQMFLPFPVGYGASVSSSKGLICIGGMDESAPSRRVYRLRWNDKISSVEVKRLPHLPFPLTNHTAAIVDNKLLVTGGVIDLNKAVPNRYLLEYNFKTLPFPKWNLCSCIPGKPRLDAQSASISDGLRTAFYLYGGTWKGEVTNELWSLNPTTMHWNELSTTPHFLKDSTFIEGGANTILLLNENESASYHTITNTWAKRDPFFSGYQDRSMIRWGNMYLFGPTKETGNLVFGKIKSPYSMNGVNLLFFSLYIALMLWIGFHFMRDKETTDEYYKASGKIPWWAAGISIFGTVVSAVACVSYPAKSFASDWQYMTSKIALILVIPLIIFAFLPFYRRLPITSVYQYLEFRFNVVVRLLGSCAFIVLQLLKVGIVLFLSALVLSISTGLNIQFCIVTIGFISIIYTTLGGIEAVIWTDVIQVCIFFCGTVLAAIYCLKATPLPLGEIISTAVANDKIKIFDFAFDFNRPTFWVIVLGNIGYYITSLGTDQPTVQRYLTVKKEKEAARSLWVYLALVLSMYFFLFITGTAIYVFYKTQPELLNPLLSSADGILPHFSVTTLSSFCSSIILTGIFAAAMSTVDSGINSLATVISTDFLRRFYPLTKDETEVKFAKVMTALTGVVATVYAIVLSKMEIISIMDHMDVTIAFTVSSITGIFILGIFTKVAHSTGVLAGFILNVAFLAYIHFYTSFHFLLLMGLGPFSSALFGLIASYLMPPSQKDTRFVYSNLENLKQYKDD